MNTTQGQVFALRAKSAAFSIVITVLIQQLQKVRLTDSRQTWNVEHLLNLPSHDRLNILVDLKTRKEKV
jgi:hypothetical protein